MRGDGRLFPRGRWLWISYMHNGKEQREPARDRNGKNTNDRAVAEKYLRSRRDEVATELNHGPTFETHAARKLTVAQLIEALRADFRLRGKASPQNLSNLSRVEKDFGEYRAVKLMPESVDAYIEKRLAVGDKPASINRVTQLLGQAYKLAIVRRRLARAPYIRHLSEKGNERRISLTEKQFADFLAALPDDDLRDFAQWSAACAMRKGEASELTWNMLHGNELKVPSEICKNKNGHVLPIEDELCEIVERRKKARRMDCQYIFHRAGQQIKQFDKSRRTAAKKANLPAGFVFHTLRSFAATNMIDAGVSPEVALAIGNWKTPSMLHRYLILKPDKMREGLAATKQHRLATAKREQEQAAKVVSMTASR